MGFDHTLYSSPDTTLVFLSTISVIRFDCRYGRITSSYTIYLLYGSKQSPGLHYSERQEITLRFGQLSHHKGLKPQQRYVPIYSFVRLPAASGIHIPRTLLLVLAVPHGPCLAFDCSAGRTADRRTPVSRRVFVANHLEVPHGPHLRDAAHLGYEGPRGWLHAEERCSSA